MSRPLADTHAHLADPALRSTAPEVVAAAEALGVGRILTVGTDLATSAECVRLAERFPSVYAAVGIHPSEADQLDASSLAELRRLARLPKVVAIGEIGLDYYRDAVVAETQRRVFAEQLHLAADLGLPVVVHNRKADADVLAAIGAVGRPRELRGRAGVLHCFGGTAEMASEAREKGFFVSFAGNLTFKRAEELRAAAAAIPLDWILTETDSPYLAPVPHRGTTNTPGNARRVAETLATVRGLPFDTVANATWENSRRLFAWG